MLLKKLLLTATSLLAIVITHAQFSKGNRVIAANIGGVFFNSGKTVYTYPPPTTGVTGNVRNFGINLNPTYGWFINEKVAAGPSILISYNHTKTFFTDDNNGNTFSNDITNNLSIGLGGFIRNYFTSTGSFIPYGQFGLNAGMSSSKTEGYFFTAGDKSTYDGKSSGGFFFNAGLGFGLIKKLSAHTALDFSLAYNYSYDKSEFKKTTKFDEDNNGSIDATTISQPTQKHTNHGVILGVGFQIFLDKKK